MYSTRESPGSVGRGTGRPVDEIALADLIESQLNGVTERDAQTIAAEHPEVVGAIVTWIREAAQAMNWRRAGKFANLAARLHPPGLAAVLQEIFDSYFPGTPGLNGEDLVEILGEIGSSDSVSCLFRVAERFVIDDAPDFWLIQKVILSLREIGTTEALDDLRSMTASSWPDPVRWHAAVMLGIEDDIGFNEDEMLG